MTLSTVPFLCFGIQYHVNSSIGQEIKKSKNKYTSNSKTINKTIFNYYPQNKTIPPPPNQLVLSHHTQDLLVRVDRPYDDFKSFQFYKQQQSKYKINSISGVQLLTQ